MKPAAARMHNSHDRFSSRAGARAAVIALALLWCNCAFAGEARVLMLRGWFGVFSSGLDGLADELKAKGIKAEVAGHLHWEAAVAEILRDRAAGNTGPIILIGHSQGANNVIDMARALEPRKVPVDLLVTLAPLLQNPIPANVVHAINYYQSPGWGQAIAPDPGFHGKINNVNLIGDITVTHVSIDKSERIHSELLREITAVARGK
jgi:hypothetical protein